MAPYENRASYEREPGSARLPREHRHRAAWLVLALAFAVLVPGIVLAQGLLFAAGVVLAGVAGQLFDSRRVRTGRG
ncbi:DUF3040 domain-containing protein [Streptomyces sp. SYSU K21746]